LFGEFELTPFERIAAHVVATNLAVLQRISLDLDERGILNKKGETRDLLALQVRITRDTERWAQQLKHLRTVKPLAVMVREAGLSSEPPVIVPTPPIRRAGETLEPEPGGGTRIVTCPHRACRVSSDRSSI
jgi:hypothetical protein